MGKKTALVIILVCVLWIGVGLLWNTSGPPQVGVSKLKSEPESYLGRVKVLGRAARIDPAGGLFNITSEEGCCEISIPVPSTEAQREQFGSPSLYRGTLPEQGDAVVADGVLSNSEAGFRFDLLRLSVRGQVILERI